MKVEILQYTKDHKKIIYAAGRGCYSDRPDINVPDGQITSFIHKIIKSQHESILEHAIITVKLNRVSRNLMAQITRHRLCSFSFRSTHYSNYKDVEFRIPEGLMFNDLVAYLDLTQKCKDVYNMFLEKGYPKEVAREILPGSALTNGIMTANVREWRKILLLRCGKENTEETFTLARMLLREFYLLMPDLFCDLRDKFFESGE